MSSSLKSKKYLTRYVFIVFVGSLFVSEVSYAGPFNWRLLWKNLRNPGTVVLPKPTYQDLLKKVQEYEAFVNIQQRARQLPWGKLGAGAAVVGTSGYAGYQWTSKRIDEGFASIKQELDLSDFPVEFSSFIENVLDHYFEALPMDHKAQLLAAYAAPGWGASSDDRIESVYLHSGVVVQKFFQMFANQARDPKLKAKLERMKEGQLPMSQEALDNTLSEVFLGTAENIFKQGPLKALGVGSIGEVRKITLNDGRPAVLKILKPRVKAQVEKEIAALRYIVENWSSAELKEKHLEIVAILEQEIHKELNFTQEKENLRKGKKFYEVEGSGIFVAGLVDGVHHKSYPNAIVTELAPGVSMASLPRSPKNDLAKVLALQNLFKKWAEAALFGNGFAHVDLHGGNVFILVENNEGPEGDAPGSKPIVTLIDFGSCTSVRDFQAALSKIFVGNVLKSATDVTHGLRLIRSVSFEVTENETWKNQEVEFEVSKLLKANLSDKEFIPQVFQVLENQGIDVPTEITQFFRGFFMVQDQLEEAQEQLVLSQADREKFGVKDPAILLTEIYSQKFPGAAIKWYGLMDAMTLLGKTMFLRSIL